MSWLQMPLPLLSAYAAKLPQLEAQETLRLATAFALGGGHMKRHEAERLHRDLERAASGDIRTQARASSTRLADITDAASAMGIEVVKDG